MLEKAQTVIDEVNRLIQEFGLNLTFEGLSNGQFTGLTRILSDKQVVATWVGNDGYRLGLLASDGQVHNGYEFVLFRGISVLQELVELQPIEEPILERCLKPALLMAHLMSQFGSKVTEPMFVAVTDKEISVVTPKGIVVILPMEWLSPLDFKHFQDALTVLLQFEGCLKQR